MAQSQFSQLWYRVAALKPRLRSHVEVQRHHYRGELWFVIQDYATGRVHRFTPAAQALIGTMDGQRSVQQLWEQACERLKDETPSQDEVIQLLGQLHGADLIQCDVPPDTAELFERYQRQRRGERLRPLLSPMAIKVPLLDPERFLQNSVRRVGPVFGWAGFVVWLAVVLTGVALAAKHWPDLTRDVTDTVLSPKNLLVLWLVFPVVKAMHELGHAFAVKVWGGEVHEMGLMFLVLMPVPYVDASAASAFRDKKRRAVVGAAGMMVELFLASLALMLWIVVEPGIVRAVCYNVMLIAGVSTVIFNGNPLLRFDGYYILSDLIEIPNLAQRSTRHWAWLAQRYIYRLKDLEPPSATAGERRWFVFYAPVSLIYRLAVSFGIVLFVASQFFFVGVLLALWSAVTMLVLPAAKAMAFLGADPRLRNNRARASAVTAALAGGIGLLLFAIPMPLRTHADGIVWVPEQAIVLAETSGFFDRFVATPGTSVKPGDVLAESFDPALAAELKSHAARVEELQSRFTLETASGNRVESQVIADKLAAGRAHLERIRERVLQLTVRAHVPGIFVVAQPEDFPGRFVRQGEQLGYVVDLSEVTARVVVNQTDVDLVRTRTRSVELRPAEFLSEVFAATVRREVPAASNSLPSKALTPEGGGSVPVDPSDRSGTKTLTRHFQLDLAVHTPLPLTRVGGHVYVRFDHGWEPLGIQGYRRLRQLFLSQFNV
jgi:putative peptide zinc metalloprotease protein